MACPASSNVQTGDLVQACDHNTVRCDALTHTHCGNVGSATLTATTINPGACLLTINGNVDIDGDLEFQGAQSITTTAGDLTFNPTANIVVQACRFMRNSNNNLVVLQGGEGTCACALGGNIVLYGPNHATCGATVQVRSAACTEIEVNGTGIGFFGAAPIAKPTVTGSRACNVALADLLTELANLGLVNDCTTA